MEGKEKKKDRGRWLCVVEDKTNKDESGGVRLIEVYKVSRVSCIPRYRNAIVRICSKQFALIFRVLCGSLFGSGLI